MIKTSINTSLLTVRNRITRTESLCVLKRFLLFIIDATGTFQLTGIKIKHRTHMIHNEQINPSLYEGNFAKIRSLSGKIART